VTRGQGGRGYYASPELVPSRILLLNPQPAYPAEHAEEGVRVRICETRLSINAKLAGLKHLNRLEQVLARNEWQTEFSEGLLMDTAGHVIEGTMSNLFLVKNNRLMTPSLKGSGVKGVVRDYLLKRAQVEGVDHQESVLSLDDVMGADSLFITNSLIGIWPVRELDNKHFSINPLIRAAQSWLEEARQRA
jgi:4-amino-4-deoxychorismate lyase